MSLWEIYLPVAGVKANVIILVIMGFVTGVAGGLFGFGGGLIITPYLLLSGVPVPVAVATATNQMTAGTISAFIKYAKHDLVDYKLASTMLFGSIIGCIVGMEVFNILSAKGVIDTVVPMIFLIILLITTYSTVKDAIKILLKRNNGLKTKPLAFFAYLPFQTNYISCPHAHSMLIPIFIGMVGGILISIVGLGGGFIMVPAMLYLLQCQEKFISGTTIFQIVFTSILSTILHSATHRHIDIVLAAILIVGTVFGSQIGSTIGRKIHPDRYRLLLALIIFIIAVKFAYSTFLSPDNLYQITPL